MTRFYSVIGAVLWGISIGSGPAAAQDQSPSSGSPGFTSKTRSVASGSELANSANFRIRATAGSAALGGGDFSSSSNYKLQGGISSIGATYATNAPVLFGILSNAPPTAGIPQYYGSAQGGDPIMLVGTNFTLAGAGLTNVTIGLPATEINISSNSTITCKTPVGKDISGTPLGPTPVTVTNSKGFSTLPSGWVFTPGLMAVNSAHLGEEFVFRSVSQGGGVIYLLVGGTQPNLYVPGVPVSGMLQILPILIVAGPVPTPGILEFSIPIPDDPGLLGGQGAMQAINIPAALGQQPSFSNKIVVTIS